MCLVRPMTASVEGGCLCGGVRYRLHGTGKQGSDCHCEDCRRASAAPYVTWCSFPSDAVELLSGELRQVLHASRLRFFASCCGTPLFIRDDASSGWIDITVASLDDPKSFPPHKWLFGLKTSCHGSNLIRRAELFYAAETKMPNQAMRRTAGRSAF